MPPARSAAVRRVNPLFAVAIVFGAVFAVAAASRLLGPRDGAPWRFDPAAGLADARSAGKPALVRFTADWCEACHVMKQTVWSTPAVQREAAARYVPVSVDVDRFPEFAGRYGKDGQLQLPTVVVMDADGKVAREYPGEVDDAAGFLEWLKRAE